MSERQVFINCPFSVDYQDHFRAIVFAVIRSGYTPRCARENDDGAEIRFNKICRIIEDCDYGVHDISKTEPDPGSGLPRFNMPLELGLFLGAKKYGSKKQKAKNALILDREAFRYQQFISDIAGQDIHAHNGDVAKLIGEVATWLRDAAPQDGVPGGVAIAAEYQAFLADLPSLCADKQLDPDEITFKDVTLLAAAWIVATAKAAA
ncbi:hypothetical protein [Phenylobacterium montanum]|uniref:Uncharacterized protein n=1 Tax=Phenylobacterium montanum TaxID=2823693 RepID=A0A975G2G2_9CAUL|nr:hypothetical protein [Caulobacter sp. S6]QUD89554.1 hypothetical protein KCG34_06645 [Caulobacter sp. S6]